MKKKLLIILAIVLVMILSTIAYFFIWGGKPQIDNFADISNDYECIANSLIRVGKAFNCHCFRTAKSLQESKYVI